MNDSEFDRVMKETFLSAAEERQLWPKVVRRLPRPMSIGEWLAPLVAAGLALLILHHAHTSGPVFAEPAPVATIALQPPGDSPVH